MKDILRDSRNDGLKFNKSILRSIERLEGMKALMATWEAVKDDSREHVEYLQHLRKQTTTLRQQLKVKGVSFGEGDE